MKKALLILGTSLIFSSCFQPPESFYDVEIGKLLPDKDRLTVKIFLQEKQDHRTLDRLANYEYKKYNHKEVFLKFFVKGDSVSYYQLLIK